MDAYPKIGINLCFTRTPRNQDPRAKYLRLPLLCRWFYARANLLFPLCCALYTSKNLNSLYLHQVIGMVHTDTCIRWVSEYIYIYIWWDCPPQHVVLVHGRVSITEYYATSYLFWKHHNQRIDRGTSCQILFLSVSDDIVSCFTCLI